MHYFQLVQVFWYDILSKLQTSCFRRSYLTGYLRLSCLELPLSLVVSSSPYCVMRRIYGNRQPCPADRTCMLLYDATFNNTFQGLFFLATYMNSGTIRWHNLYYDNPCSSCVQRWYIDTVKLSLVDWKPVGKAKLRSSLSTFSFTGNSRKNV